MIKYIGIDLGLSKPTWISCWDGADKMINFLSVEPSDKLVGLKTYILSEPKGSIVLIEEPFMGNNVKFLKQFCKALGILEEFCDVNGYKFNTVMPMRWQKDVLKCKFRANSDERKQSALNVAWAISGNNMIFHHTNIPVKKMGANKGNPNYKGYIYDLADAVCIGYYANQKLKEKDNG